MKLFLLLLFVTNHLVYGQQLFFTETGDSLSIVSNTYYDSTENEKRIETYLNGKLIKSQGFYENNQIKYERNYRGDTLLNSIGWYETGIIKSIRLIAGDTIRETVYCNELGKIVEYDSFRKGKKIQRTYDWYDNTLASEFYCDYNKNKECFHITYYEKNKIYWKFVSKPLKFLQVDSDKIEKISRESRLKQLYPIWDKYYDENGTLRKEVFYKNGIKNKSVDYFKKGKEINYYDNDGQVIKTKVKGHIEEGEYKLL